MERLSTRLITINTSISLVILFLGSLTSTLGLLPLTNFIRYLIVILMYITINIIIWQEADQLHIFNLDRSSVWLVIFTGFFRSRLEIPNEVYFKVLIASLSILMLLGVIKFRRKIPKTKWRWVGIGLIFCAVIIPISILEMAYPDRYITIRTDPNFSIAMIRRILNNISFVSLVEEVIFRSLLWGILRKLGVMENRIFVVQGLAFWLLHLSSLAYALSFFVTLPIGIIIYSYLAHKSKQVFPSIILHTILNSAGPLLVHLLVTS